MKKKITQIIIAILCCLAFSALIESLFFNFNAVFKKPESLQNISYSKSTTEDTVNINLDLTDQYINKFVINYKTSHDIKYDLIYYYYGLYGNIEEEIFSDIFDDTFNKSVTNIDKTISSISIKYTLDSKSTDLEFTGIDIDNSFHFNMIRATCTFLTLGLIFSFFFFYKDGFKTEKLHIYFAISCLFIGGIVIVAQPSATFYSWDDQIHFEGVVDLFTGKTIYTIGEYNLTDANIANSAGRDSIDSIEEQNAQNEYYDSGLSSFSRNTSWLPSYNKVAYIPASIGYHLAKIINLPFSACFKIGKLFNLLFYVLLISYAIKTIKIGKKLLAVIALIPTNIFLASEYSYDPAVFAGISVFFAHLVNLFIDKNSKFDFKKAIIIISAMSLACFTKAIYAPFLLLVLLIPKDRFKCKRQSLLVKAGFVGITILLLATFVLPLISGTMGSDSRGGDTSVGRQLSLIISHPSDYIKLLGDNAVRLFTVRFTDGFMDFAYIQDVAARSSANFLSVIIFVLFFLFFTDNKGNQLSKKYRAIIVCANLIVIIAIWTALYLSYSPVGANSIRGVQSRYFLPLIFPILICLQPKNIISKINPKIQTAVAIIAPSIVAVILFISSILATYSY